MTGLLLRKRVFRKFVCKIAVKDSNKPENIFTGVTVPAQQEESEAELTDIFEATNMCTLHDKCVIIIPKDINLARKLSKCNTGSGL